MKKVFQRNLLTSVLGLLLWLPANHALGANAFFDVNGTAPGSGVIPGGSYTWEGTFWAPDNTGTSVPVAWVEGNFPEFSTGSDATGNYSVTAGSPHTIAGALQRTSTG